MEWYWILVLVFSGLILLMLTRMPIFAVFMLVNVVGFVLLFDGLQGINQLVLSIESSLVTFILLPIPMFILMGEILFRSGIAQQVLNTLDHWLGRLPGRLGVLAIFSGAAFSTLTGTSTAGTAMLGSMLTPEMEARKYRKSMSIGTVLGSGGLAIMIPPSSLAVILGAIGEISIGRLLLAIIIPGMLMACLYTAYVIVRCWIQPSIAPAYEIESIPMSRKVRDTIVYVLPLGSIFFLTVGLIILGFATPTEAAALGALGAFVIVAIYGKLTWNVVKESVIDTLKNSGMILIIVAASTAFSQLLAFSGATQGLVDFAVSLPAAPIVIIICMMIVIMIMGGFMSLVAIMLITLPIFVPVVSNLGYDPVWFGVLFLINIEMALTTPPLGINLYVMKGVAPSDTTMVDIILAALPFLALDLVAILLVMGFPDIALWLPSLVN